MKYLILNEKTILNNYLEIKSKINKFFGKEKREISFP